MYNDYYITIIFFMLFLVKYCNKSLYYISCSQIYPTATFLTLSQLRDDYYNRQRECYK